MIQQFYLTHCTYSTSALEKKTGELAQKPLGYSARAASLSGQALRDAFRRLERYVYYYLPNDTPPALRETLAPQAAPIRLVCLPATEAGSVVLQAVYRPKDTAGRVGSYFAHVLTLPKDGGGAPTPPGGSAPVLAPVSALRTWAAPGWKLEDSDFMPQDLSPLANLTELLAGNAPAIDERVLVSFLQTPENGEFYDPRGILPERWRKLPASERQRLFCTFLAGIYSKFDTANASILAAAEPSAAALLFFGACTFFPRALAKKFSFSTYEPDPTHLMTRLAATSFHNPESADLPEELYHGTNFTLNTWNGRTSDDFNPEALENSYVGRVWEEFAAGGLEQVRTFCATFESVGAGTIADLAAMMDAEATFSYIVKPDAGHPVPPVPEELPLLQNRMGAAFLRKRLVDYVAKMAAPETDLAPIVGTPNQLLLLELLGGAPADSANLQPALLFLLKNLTDAQLPLWLRHSAMSDDTKSRVLERFFRKNGTLPPGCEFLWQLAVSTHLDRDANAPVNASKSRVLTHLITNLDDASRIRLAQCPAVGSALTVEFLLVFEFGVSFLMDEKGMAATADLRTALDRYVAAAPLENLIAVYRKYGRTFFLHYPGDVTVLGEKCDALESNIFQKFETVGSKLKLLFDIQECLSESAGAKVRNWRDLRDRAVRVTELQAPAGGKVPNVKALDAACQLLAAKASEILSDERLKTVAQERHERLASVQSALLRDLTRQWSGGKELLPGENPTHQWLRRKIEAYLATRTWPAATGKSFLRSRQGILIILGGVVIGLLAAFLFFLLSSGSGDSEKASASPEVTAPEPTKPEPVKKPKKKPKHEIVDIYEDEEDEESSAPASRKTPAEEEIAEVVVPLDDSELPGSKAFQRIPYIETPAETRAAWDALFVPSANVKVLDIPLLSTSERPIPGVVGVEAASRENIASLAGFHSSHEKGMQLDGGYLLFEGTVFPFGTVPEGIVSPKKSDGAAVTASKKGGKKSSKVLRSDEFEGDTLAKNLQLDEPGQRYDLPQLAEALGFSAIFVQLSMSEDGLFYVTLDARRKNMTEEDMQTQSTNEKRANELKSELQILRSSISACETVLSEKKASSETRLKAFQTLARLLECEDRLNFPDPPNPDDYATRRLYESAVEEYRIASESQGKVLKSILDMGLRRQEKLAGELADLQYRLSPEEGEPTPEESANLERLTANVENLKVLLSREGGFGPSAIRIPGEEETPEEPEPKKSVFGGTLVPPEDAEAEEEVEETPDPFADDVPSNLSSDMELDLQDGFEDVPGFIWKLDDSKRAKPKELAGNLATLGLTIVPKGVQKAAFFEKYRVQATIYNQLEGKRELSVLQQVPDVVNMEPVQILQTTQSICIRISFHEISPSEKSGKKAPAYAVPPLKLEPIREGKAYSIRVELGEAASETLLGKIKKNKRN